MKDSLMPTSRKKPVAAKPASAKRAAKTAAKPAPLPPPHPVQAAKKEAKEKKPKLVRDSFTIPKPEYAVLEALKQRAAQAGAPSKKSEVLRAGIKALAGLSDTAFLAAMKAVPSLKTGRPAKQ
jgi:hypothetical protein